MPGDHRINFRAKKDEIELIKQAAVLRGQSMVSFGLGVMLYAARKVVSECPTGRLPQQKEY